MVEGLRCVRISIPRERLTERGFDSYESIVLLYEVLLHY